MPLNTLLARHARYRLDHTALVFDDTRLTWEELARRVNRTANALHDRGLRRGDKLATLLDNGLEVVELYHAAAITGIVIVPLSPLLRGQGLANLLVDSDASALVAMSRMVPHLEEVRSA